MTPPKYAPGSRGNVGPMRQWAGHVMEWNGRRFFHIPYCKIFSIHIHSILKIFHFIFHFILNCFFFHIPFHTIVI